MQKIRDFAYQVLSGMVLCVSRNHCKKFRKNLSVIPAKTEIHFFRQLKTWIRFCNDMTTFSMVFIQTLPAIFTAS